MPVLFRHAVGWHGTDQHALDARTPARSME